MTQPQHTEQGSCPEAWLPDSSFRPHPLQPFRQQGELRQEPQRIAIPLQRLPSCHPPTPTKQSPPPHKNPPERTSLRRVTSLNRENRQQGFNKHESLWRGKGGVWGGEGEPFSRKVPLPPPIFHPSTVRRRAEAGSGHGCPGPRARTRRAWRIDGPR